MPSFPLSRRKFLALSGAVAAGGASLPLRAADSLKAERQAAAASNAFAADLYRALAGQEGKEKGSLFLSPLSIEVSLAMTSAGARGKTLEEMEKVLHLPKEPHAAFGQLTQWLTAGDKDVKREYELSIANAIWAHKDYPWEKGFLELTRKHYGAGTVEVDFAQAEAARKRINEWAEKETRQKVKDLIPPGKIDASTRMVLANAVYFKSNWLIPFDKKATRDAPFTHADGTKADVPLMTKKIQLPYAEQRMFVLREGETVQVLQLPYTDEGLSLLVFLPDSPSGVHRLAQWLTPDLLSGAKVNWTAAEVTVFLPRFKVESALSVRGALTGLGMNLAFGGADFTGMSPQGKELFISDVLHKTFVDVNEEGTEAAGATAVVTTRGGAPERKEFRADRPFVFAIRDHHTGAVLFLGRYMGPKAS